MYAIAKMSLLSQYFRKSANDTSTSLNHLWQDACTA